MYVCNPAKSGLKSIAGLVFSCALLALSAVLLSLQAGAASDIEKEYGGIIQMRSAGELINVERVSNIFEKRDFEKEDVKFTAWSQKNDITVTNHSLGSRAQLDCALYYFGDNNAMFDLVLHNGCALSKAAAFKIFGTANGVLGETIVVDGVKYVVERLIISDAAPLIYKISEDDTRAGFDALNIENGADASISASEMQMAYGVSGDIAVDYCEVAKSCAALARLLLWAGFIIAAIIFTGGVAIGSNKWVKRAVRCVGLFLAALCCIFIIGSPFYIPSGFVPTRWSEFEFWSVTFSRFWSSLSYYFSMKAYAPDIVFRSGLMKMFVLALLSAASIIAAAALARKKAAL